MGKTYGIGTIAKQEKSRERVSHNADPSKARAREHESSRELEVDLRHPHGEETDHAFVIERLEDVPTDERVVDTGIFVVAEVGEVMLANVHHSGVCV